MRGSAGEASGKMRLRIAEPSGRNVEPGFTLHLTGGFNLQCGNRVVPLRSRKGAALLAYLALNAPQRQSREHLAGLLWSESEESQARASLRQTLKGLRQDLEAVGLLGLQGDRFSIGIDTEALGVDILNALRSVESWSASQLLLSRERVAESLLEGFEDIDPSFRAWLSVQRQTLHDLFVRHLEAALAEGSDYEAASRRDLAMALANLEPSNETACRTLMEYYTEKGDIAAALRRYNEIWELLDEDFDMEPSEQTQDLAVSIKSGESRSLIALEQKPSLPDTSAVEVHEERKIVLHVAEFELQGVSEERRYQVEGFRLDLTASLIRFREWTVVDGLDSAAMASDVRPMDCYRIDAGVFEDCACLRLILTLRDMRLGQYVWSDRFDFGFENWFSTQQAVVRRIAVALNVHLSAERLSRFDHSAEIPAHLYDRWLLGQELSFRWRPEAELRADEVFRSIIDEAPDFAPAYASLVQIANSRHLIFPGVLRSAKREKESLSLAKQAVHLDPLDSRTHLCLAWSSALNQQFNQAELSYRLATDLNSNDPWTLVSSSLGLAFCGDLPTARELADHALSLDLGVSRLNWGYQVCVWFLEGEYRKCIEAADRAQDMMFGLPAWKAAALAHLDRKDEAEAEARRFFEVIRAHWHAQSPPDEETILRWVLHSYPVRRYEDWKRLRDGLRGAGVSVPSSIEFLYRPE